MDFDISHLLDHWAYQPGQMLARRFKGKDGRDKIQLRLDLGLLQMNAEGRPDGKRPFGHTSLYDFYRSKLHKHVAAHDGSDEGFRLSITGASFTSVAGTGTALPRPMVGRELL